MPLSSEPQRWLPLAEFGLAGEYGNAAVKSMRTQKSRKGVSLRLPIHLAGCAGAGAGAGAGAA